MIIKKWTVQIMKEIEWMDQNTMEGRHDMYKRIIEGMDVGESSDIQEGNGEGIPEFRESSGPTHNLAGAEPVAFLNHLWTEELDMAILTETNRYGDQYTETHCQHLKCASQIPCP